MKKRKSFSSPLTTSVSNISLFTCLFLEEKKITVCFAVQSIYFFICLHNSLRIHERLHLVFFNKVLT